MPKLIFLHRIIAFGTKSEKKKIVCHFSSPISGVRWHFLISPIRNVKARDLIIFFKIGIDK